MKQIIISGISIFFLVLSAGNILATQPERPNIIFIMADDLGWADPGFNGGDASLTPNIDQLAREGIRFNLAYANQAVCVASRYNLMLGKRSTSTGLYRFGVNFRAIYPSSKVDLDLTLFLWRDINSLS